jgi:hypothetical protein
MTNAKLHGGTNILRIDAAFQELDGRPFIDQDQFAGALVPILERQARRAVDRAKAIETFVTGLGGEVFNGSEYDTREEAIAGAEDEFSLESGDRFSIGRRVEVEVDIGDPDWGAIVERMEVPDDVVDSRWPHATKEQEAELRGEMNRVVKAWLSRHGFTPTWYKVEDITEHTVLGKVALRTVINGVLHPIEVDRSAPLQHCRDRALHETGNRGRPVEDWECRNGQGDILNLQTTAGDLPQAPDLIYVNLRAGWGA